MFILCVRGFGEFCSRQRLWLHCTCSGRVSQSREKLWNLWHLGCIDLKTCFDVYSTVSGFQPGTEVKKISWRVPQETRKNNLTTRQLHHKKHRVSLHCQCPAMSFWSLPNIPRTRIVWSEIELLENGKQPWKHSFVIDEAVNLLRPPMP